jgi:glycosyltransferase involved in cell wall biosynthesis
LSAVAGRLRIAQLAPPVEPVPPAKYGGTEQVISVLTEELVRRGHAVTLFASGDSQTAARLVPTVDRALWSQTRYTEVLPFLALAIDAVYSRAAEFDVIHNHIDFLAFPAASARPRPPTVSTLHGRLDLREFQPLYRHFARLSLVSISDAQRGPIPWANWAATVHHGLDLAAFPFRPAGEGYLAFLGRVAPEKGLDTAIAVARRAGRRLRIAARLPLDQPHNPEAQRDWRYYREVIGPLLSEPHVEYVGEVAGDAKARLLGGADALLFPIRWPEPFGLVMAEALACGTPVVALRRGSAPEVVRDGETGFLADDDEGLVRALGRLSELDRARCRAEAEARFSVAAMADGYEAVYRRLLGLAPADALADGALGARPVRRGTALDRPAGT